MALAGASPWWTNGGPVDWILAFEKNICYMHAIKKVLKGTYVEIHNDFKDMFNF